MGHEIEEGGFRSVESATLNYNLVVIIALFLNVLVAVCAQFLVRSIKSVVKSNQMSRTFIGLILLPFSLNAPRSLTIRGDSHNMELVVGEILERNLEIILFIIPLLVISGWITNQSMALNFNIFETAIFFLSVLVVNNRIRQSRSSFIEGIMCLGL
jgi:Ca2+:H+ antiporter